MDVTFFGQDQISKGQQGIFWYKFLIDGKIENQDEFVESFLHSNTFRTYCLPFVVKRNIESSDQFLNNAFNIEMITIKDFKTVDKRNLLDFFDTYSMDSSWGIDKEDFLGLKMSFDKYIDEESVNRFYLISKEWFEIGSKILTDSATIYIYYFLIIWVDEKRNILNVCEWNYD